MSSTESVPLRFTQTDQQYLDSHHIRTHLSDALSLITNVPSKVKQMEFLANYFTLLSTTPSHLLHRDFKYLNSTPFNRRSFLRLFRRSFFAKEKSDTEKVALVATSLEETVLPPEMVHQLCLLICNDFPFSLVRNAARITNDVPSGAINPPHPPQMTFKEFAHKLFVLFYYSEFLNQCALTFRSLDTSGSGRVSRSAFLSRLKEVLAKKGGEFSCPPLEAVEDALGSPSLESSATELDLTSATDDGVMFNTFCVELFAHRMIHHQIQTGESEVVDGEE